MLIKRKRLISIVAAVAAGGLVAACGGVKTPPKNQEKTQQKMTQDGQEADAFGEQPVTPKQSPKAEKDRAKTADADPEKNGPTAIQKKPVEVAKKTDTSTATDIDMEADDEETDPKGHDLCCNEGVLDETKRCVVGMTASIPGSKIYVDPIQCDLSFKQCSGADAGKTFGCRTISSGVQPIKPLPQVCGCLAACADGEFLIASASTGTWPDGSLKGSFSCAIAPPP